MKTFSLHDSVGIHKELTGWLKGAGLVALTASAHRIVEKIITDIIPNTSPSPVDRGAYRAAWRVRDMDDGSVIENVSKHGPFVDLGVPGARVRVGKKMIVALTAWVIRKGMVGSSSVKTKRRRVSASDKKQAVGIAWAIAKSMQKNGIFNHGKGLRVLERALVGVDVIIREEYARAMK